MMRTLFWILRFLAIFAGCFLFLATVYTLRGRSAEVALRDSGVWSLITTSVFLGAQVYHQRRGRTCSICSESPNSEC